ncbi:MAG: UDP-N-acetylmuramate:L-alanyl-gamma-D-glutamyl-meso-diaminopimelate ligase [Betaproteobacteria bacterium]|nr:UDP-N-acetylmuramate:L-alanyl-gamma-D-glutamyl-meso-diaminopimelate ligase [Betaproteobacteria bacterium]
MHLHILGICGTFMGGIAAIAKAAGHTVTGCDANVYPPMSTQLDALGIGLVEGWEADQLDGVARGADVFVVGNAVTRGKPVMEAILNRGLAYTSGPQWLFENVLQGRWVLAVAGTHGKTTTTAMLAFILERAGLAPGFLIGGVPVDFDFSARLTASNFFVIEADEYDTAFFDKRSKFVHYRPRTAVLNNLEYDHADIFADLGAIETQFHHLVRTVPGEGLLVVNGGEASLQRVLDRGCWSSVERFGAATAWDLDAEGDIRHHGQVVGRLQLDLPGRHNQLNALAALLAARHVGVPLAQGLEALAGFGGVKRRLEKRGEVRGITVYDDFAHHPTAIAATLAALRDRIGKARLIAVLEPRSNTMKLGTMKAQLPESLAAADRVFCYAGGLGWDAAAALTPLGDKAETWQDLDGLVHRLARSAQPGDHLLIMSNGGFGGIHDKLLRALS